MDEHEMPYHLMPQYRTWGQLSAVEVPLTVSLGTILVTVAELENLSRGQQLELCFDPLASVSLTLGQDEVARGQFILVDNQLYLEVIEVATLGAE